MSDMTPNRDDATTNLDDATTNTQDTSSTDLQSASSVTDATSPATQEKFEMKATDELSSSDLAQDTDPTAETQQEETQQEDYVPTESNNIAFGATRDKRRKKVNPGKDTTILSGKNPMLRRAISANADTDELDKGTTTVGEKRELLLLIRGMVERVVMDEGIVYKLGRSEIGVTNPDEIDLTPYGAMDRGVSRVHASLQLKDGQVFVTDLNSTNGTYLAGERLLPDEPTALSTGSELLLGRLNVEVLFR